MDVKKSSDEGENVESNIFAMGLQDWNPELIQVCNPEWYPEQHRSLMGRPTRVLIAALKRELTAALEEEKERCEREKKGRLKSEEIYEAMCQFDNWRKCAKNMLGISVKNQRKMLGKSGLINEKIKLRMLYQWMNKQAYDDPQEALIRLVEEFTGRKAKRDAFDNRDFKFISRIVTAAIAEDDWMEFARMKLDLSDSEIENIIGKYGEFTDDLKYQMIKMVLNQETDDPSWEKWELHPGEYSADVQLTKQ